MAVRPVNGSDSRRGLVEVLHLGSWDTVCDNAWDMRDANVVCRMLGYSGALAAYGGAKYGLGKGRV